MANNNFNRLIEENGIDVWRLICDFSPSSFITGGFNVKELDGLSEYAKRVEYEYFGFDNFFRFSPISLQNQFPLITGSYVIYIAKAERMMWMLFDDNLSGYLGWEEK